MNIERLVEGLPIIGYGLLGVFMVIGIISVLVVIMTKVFSSKDKENNK